MMRAVRLLIKVGTFLLMNAIAASLRGPHTCTSSGLFEAVLFIEPGTSNQMPRR